MDKIFLTEREAGSYSPLSLAFLGDSVYDTLVREYLLRKANMPVSKLHSMKIKLVCAEFQSKAYDVIFDELTEREQAILKRGRNATGNTIPKHADAAEYRRATALESLLGYLYLTGQNERISQLFETIINSDILIDDK
ncbi:MAG: ribonuclease III [Ruminococcus sp.]|nr:ribonuclease III [Ruminococcus sp.]